MQAPEFWRRDGLFMAIGFLVIDRSSVPFPDEAGNRTINPSGV